MNSTPPTPIRRRRWPWVLLAVLGLPFLLAAATAVSVLTLDRNAACLREEVLQVLEADHRTVVQASAGQLALGGVRAVLAVIDHEPLRDARLALAAIRSVSIGVYELGEAGAAAGGAILGCTDAAMGERGWSRVVGVRDGEDTVMIYVPTDADEPDEVCLAVVSGRDLVVVAARIRPAAVRALVERHAGGRLHLGRRAHLAKS